MKKHSIVLTSSLALVVISPLEKGSRTVDWDMRDTIDGSKLGTGEYTYRAVWIPEYTLAYRGCFYPTSPDANRGSSTWSG